MTNLIKFFYLMFFFLIIFSFYGCNEDISFTIKHKLMETAKKKKLTIESYDYLDNDKFISKNFKIIIEDAIIHSIKTQLDTLSQ